MYQCVVESHHSDKTDAFTQDDVFHSVACHYIGLWKVGG